MESKITTEKRYANQKEVTTKYFKPTQGDLINITEIDALIRDLDAQAVAENKKFFKIMVRADKWTTLKGVSTILQMEEYDNYLVNKVKDMKTKFWNFFQLQVTTSEKI